MRHTERPYVLRLCEKVHEANVEFAREVVVPRIEAVIDDFRDFRLTPIVVVLLIERAVDFAIGALWGLATAPFGFAELEEGEEET